ncbi:CoA transferase [Ilumatobacter sp.]|uniref:CoA transferase n=1 Tax=Ilumatobacter sp. TaxID=1967498 RepID=UPI003AF85060
MSPISDAVTIDGMLPGPMLRTGELTVRGQGSVASAFDVGRLLAATSVHCVAALDDFGDTGGGRVLDLDQVAAFCTTHLDIDGEPVPVWADLSGIYPTADDRHLQIHCNFPHHADGVVDLLGTTHDRAEVAAAIARHDAVELETALVERGMIAAAVRTLDEWNAHPHALATADLPLLDVEQIGAADPRPGTDWAGTHVLDCSRVLAGPVAGQLLAGVGANVLRVGAEHLPSVPVGVISTGFGKRNAFVDLRTAEGGTAMETLLGGTDVWIDAFRPGSMAALGFAPDRVAEFRPGVVIVQVSAFDWTGPWAGRRGYDSIVQSTTGIRWAGGESATDETGRPDGRDPIGLPVQALDYATGFLAAGVAARLLRHQRQVGGSWLARLSLLRTRNWLVGLGGPSPYVPRPVTVAPHQLDETDSEFGRLTAVRPFAGEWHGAPRRLGTSDPIW